MLRLKLIEYHVEFSYETSREVARFAERAIRVEFYDKEQTGNCHAHPQQF